ncbi:hypothetical protein NSK_003528 [Nannochloropsis salina CCMP1776]|uniref:Peptidase M16 C-terminal domain-containing protein n=1 Tax=Nannochloropsis salina CCMP1776 TaxID=1027361 RepID=A0A4D9D6M3_9STRA|nr:hypothetical protein NSK_003528 [Nannochloropsis salina CCMP1776]|eukprot:TFJ85105.1 hypothetical protein NSK_003528 [Nannochloropsis salina CCMP1776]
MMMRRVGRAVSTPTLLLRRTLASLPSYVTSAPAVSTAKLSNGISVAAEAGPDELAVVSVWIDSGSRYEASSLSGASNLVARLAFRGYESEVAKLGGSVQAWAAREMTVMSAAVLKADVPAATALLGKVVSSPKFTEADVDAEKGAVLAEMEAVTVDAHEQLLFEHLHATAFQDTFLAQPVAGTPETVASLNKSTLVDFTKANFTGSRMAVAGTGGLTMEGLAAAVEGWAVGAGPTSALDEPATPSVFTGSDVRARFDSYPLAHVALAFETAGWRSKLQMPLLLVQTIIGSWDKASGVGKNGTSALSRNVAENELATSYTAFNLAYKDTGLFGVYMVAPENKLEDLAWYTLHALLKVVHQTTDEEVEYAKAQLKTNYLSSISSLAGANDNLGRQMLTYGRVMSPAEFFARVDALTVADVKAAADQVVNDQDHALAAVGPLHELPDYNWIRRRSYWLRY